MARVRGSSRVAPPSRLLRDYAAHTSGNKNISKLTPSNESLPMEQAYSAYTMGENVSAYPRGADSAIPKGPTLERSRDKVDTGHNQATTWTSPNIESLSGDFTSTIGQRRVWESQSDVVALRYQADQTPAEDCVPARNEANERRRALKYNNDLHAEADDRFRKLAARNRHNRALLDCWETSSADVTLLPKRVTESQKSDTDKAPQSIRIMGQCHDPPSPVLSITTPRDDSLSSFLLSMEDSLYSGLAPHPLNYFHPNMSIHDQQRGVVSRTPDPFPLLPHRIGGFISDDVFLMDQFLVSIGKSTFESQSTLASRYLNQVNDPGVEATGDADDNYMEQFFDFEAACKG